MKKNEEPQIQFSPDPLDTINKKLDKFFWILFSVGFVFVVTLIVMTVTLLIDSFHFNSATYKEYSDKTQSLEVIQENNKLLLDQNKQNQQIIIDLQKQILERLKQK